MTKDYNVLLKVFVLFSWREEEEVLQSTWGYYTPVIDRYVYTCMIYCLEHLYIQQR